MSDNANFIDGSLVLPDLWIASHKKRTHDVHRVWYFNCERDAMGGPGAWMMLLSVGHPKRRIPMDPRVAWTPWAVSDTAIMLGKDAACQDGAHTLRYVLDRMGRFVASFAVIVDATPEAVDTLHVEVSTGIVRHANLVGGIDERRAAKGEQPTVHALTRVVGNVFGREAAAKFGDVNAHYREQVLGGR